MLEVGLRNLEEEIFRIFYIELANEFFSEDSTFKNISPKIIQGFIILAYT